MPNQPSSETASETRNAKGEWRPPYGIKYAPLLSWPWRPLQVLKWLVSYPGFALPTNLLLLAISALSWMLTQPEVARCAHFKWDWMLWILVRNQALIWMYYGAYYLWLYVWKKEGTKGKYDRRWPARNSRVFLFNNQVWDNIFWTAGVSGLIWTGLEWLTMWLYANHHIPYLDWNEHPVWFVAWIIVIPFWREFHFYWVHRAIHWKPLYRRVHYLHHKNINPNPWSGMAMHPVEGLLYLSVALIHWVIPSHPFHFLFNLQHAGLGPAGGHDGFEGPIVHGKFPTGSYFHYLHHRYFECNYGESTLPLDKWFGTFRDGLPEGEGATLKDEHPGKG
ncbi:MAG: sterol desaturase family protein [Akkermansiaceae bacterium]|nr:sterol desaturase family protein [Akkermansiaceae bacterium]MCF7732095.1 sterol desaturase family protein [Akkermansiaceae bacterium]